MSTSLSFSSKEVEDLPDDVLFEYMQVICHKYQAMRENLQLAREQVESLKMEIMALKETSCLQQTLKHAEFLNRSRKTQSMDTSLANNESSQADEFNMAIQNVSSDAGAEPDGDDDDDDDDVDDGADSEMLAATDEDEISATPAMPSAKKRERSSKNFSVHNKLMTIKTELTDIKPAIRKSTTNPQQMKSPGAKLLGSPLRDANRTLSSTLNRADGQNRHHQRDTSTAERLNRNASLGFVDVRTIRARDAAKKVLSLSSTRSRMKQSVLGFAVSPASDADAQDRKKSVDPDETYFDDIPAAQGSKMLIKNTRQKKLTFTKTTDSPIAATPAAADQLFNFSAQRALPIKTEPPTPHRRPSAAFIEAEVAADCSNSSSVFALPSQTDDIVMIDDSQPLLCDPDASPTESDEKEPPASSSRNIRTAYKQPVSLRTNKEKEAQPGFMCPDCAPWFKFMGAKLTAADIQKRLDDCSRHRRDVRDLPSTPEGFWVPYFEDTQPSEANAPPTVDFRLRNRQQVLDESMNY